MIVRESNLHAAPRSEVSGIFLAPTAGAGRGELPWMRLEWI
ncbi:MAG: hypothetical protein WD314_00465 [Trueperaceae bacterium]